MTYDENMIRPMREEMTGAGFREARSAEDVDRVFAEEGPMLFFINSVCGCAAGVARPAVIASLNQSILPNNLVTAFAGNDVEAVNRARQHFAGYPPSSPCAAIVRDGRVMHMVERHHIEGQSAENVAQILQSAYDKYCGAEIDESVEIFDPVAALQITQQEARERLSANGDIAVLDVREPQEISARQDRRRYRSRSGQGPGNPPDLAARLRNYRLLPARGAQPAGGPVLPEPRF